MLLPSPAIVFHVFLVVPAFIAAAAGLLGFGHFLLGMRENRILNTTIFFVIFLALFFTKNVIGGVCVFSWVAIGAMLVVAMLLLALTTYLTRYLNKEPIVTTIP